MELSFTVGTHERHHVAVFFDQARGRLRITVDGQAVVDRVRTRSLSLTETHAFTVGAHERHVVRVDKHRKLLLPGLRAQTIVASVDDREVARGSTRGAAGCPPAPQQEARRSR